MDRQLRSEGVKLADAMKGNPYLVRFGDIKREVFNPNGEHLGKIEDVMLDVTNRRIAFGILSFGGLFGLGETEYAIPWDMLRYEQQDGKFLLDIAKDKLTGAERYDRTADRSRYDQAWVARTYGYWGYPPYWI